MFFVVSLGFSMQTIMSSTNRYSFISFFQIFMTFISFSCLIVLARTYSTMLNSSGERRHPCLVPHLRAKLFSLSKLTIMLAVSCFYFVVDFIKLRKFSFITSLLRGFIPNGCWTLSNAFSAADKIMWFFFFTSLLVWWIPLIDFWLLNQPCIPGTNSSWSWYIILFVCWLILHSTILLRIFASIFMRDIGW